MLRPLYRWVLLAHPPAFRRRFGDEILAIFDASPRNRDRYRLLLDGLLSLLRQWTLRRNSGNPTRSPQKSSPMACLRFNPSIPFVPAPRPCSRDSSCRSLSFVLPVSRSGIAGSGFCTSVFPKFSSSGRNGCHPLQAAAHLEPAVSTTGPIGR